MTAMWEKTDRAFHLWEYQVSHGQLLIRSPKSPSGRDEPGCDTNVDLVCLGVEYLALPASLHGLEVTQATDDEKAQIEQLLGRKLEPKNIRILVSLGQRYPIVAAFFSLSENDWDIFES